MYLSKAVNLDMMLRGNHHDTVVLSLLQQNKGSPIVYLSKAVILDMILRGNHHDTVVFVPLAAE